MGELRLLYHCVSQCKGLPVHVRHEVAPYAFKRDGGKPFDKEKGVRNRSRDVQTEVNRVVKHHRTQWLHTIEWARQRMREVEGDSLGEGRRRMREVTLKIRELFRQITTDHERPRRRGSVEEDEDREGHLALRARSLISSPSTFTGSG
ncbi:hypothetical protein BFW01_g12371 [Lasiodiplodia theobromae]|nr:hypothetical protein BFW01_g12371 [Lasiodiplodia theobromae]